MNFKINKKLFLSIALILLAPSLYAKDIAIIDAGSTHTTINFYKYDQPSDKNSLPVIKLLDSETVKPGLSSYSGNPDGAADSIKSLIDYNNLPAEEQSAPIYLMATAGMRLVSPTQQAAIYDSITKYLKTTNMQVMHVGTITGQMEGVYDWIAVNYLNASLVPGKTFGALDMGGSSTEISYEDAYTNKNTIQINLGGNTFNVNSQSFLGLGQDRAREQYTNDQNCYPVGYPLPSGKLGLGHSTQCSKDSSALVNAVHHIKDSETSIPPAIPFIAFSAYYYNALTLGIKDDMTPAELSSAATKFCNETWAGLQKDHPGDKYLPTYCFNTSYINSLITQGYNFAPDKKIKLINKISDKDIDWTWGAALYEIEHSKTK